MKNLENVKALNDMEMAMVAGGNFFSDLEDVLRNIFTNDANPTQQDNGQDEMRLKKNRSLMNAAASIPGNGKTTDEEKQQPMYGQWSE